MRLLSYKQTLTPLPLSSLFSQNRKRLTIMFSILNKIFTKNQ